MMLEKIEYLNTTGNDVADKNVEEDLILLQTKLNEVIDKLNMLLKSKPSEVFDDNHG